MPDLYCKINFLYHKTGLVVTDSYGIAYAELYIIYATANNQIIGYHLLNRKPLYLSLNLLKFQIVENIKNIAKWLDNPISHNPFFKTSPFFLCLPNSYIRDAKQHNRLEKNLTEGTDIFLDILLDIPSEYISSMAARWVLTPSQALLLIRDQIKRNRCFIQLRGL
ncbi:hypothetical protein [Pseudomonas sp. S2_B07]